MKTLLVTGGAGFIGSNFIKYMLDKYVDLRIVDLDALTYAGNLENLDTIHDHPRHIFVQGDIRDKNLVEDLFHQYEIRQVIHFAAESHVDRSIDGPEVFVTTNVLGTQVLLDVALHSWKKDPWDKYSMDFKNGVKFLQISTDEVYGALGDTGSFCENSPLMPNSPYAASKASGDLMVRAQDKRGHFPTIYENSPLMPNSPYAASKASGDLMVRAQDKRGHFPTIYQN